MVESIGSGSALRVNLSVRTKYTDDRGEKTWLKIRIPAHRQYEENPTVSAACLSRGERYIRKARHGAIVNNME